MAFPMCPNLVYLFLVSLLITPLSGLPTIVIVPGAWQSPIHYTKLTTLLRRAGYNVFSQQHPSVASSHPNRQAAAFDTGALVYDKLVPLIRGQGAEVVLVMHGYGGLVGSTAATGLGRAERRHMSLPGGIIGMIFIAALVSKTGSSWLSLQPDQRFEDWVVEYPDGQTFIADPAHLFYNDLDPNIASLFVHELRNQSQRALSTSNAPAAWVASSYRYRRAYAFTMRDNVLPLATQEAMAGLAGVDFYTRYFDTGHSPFLSQPEELCQWIVGISKPWERVGGEVNGTVAVA